MSLDSDFEVKRVSVADEDEILKFIDVHYSQDSERHIYGKIQDLGKCNAIRVRLKMSQNWSIGVYEKSSKLLVGVMLGSVQENNLESTGPELENEGLHPTPQLQALLEFFEKLEENVFKILNLEKAFFPGMVTVHSHYRSRGIASFLLEMSQNLAIKAGCKYVIATPISDYFCSSLSKRGWTVLRELDYKEYDKDNGTNIYSTAVYPFTKAQLVYKQINQSICRNNSYN